MNSFSSASVLHLKCGIVSNTEANIVVGFPISGGSDGGGDGGGDSDGEK